MPDAWPCVVQTNPLSVLPHPTMGRGSIAVTSAGSMQLADNAFTFDTPIARTKLLCGGMPFVLVLTMFCALFVCSGRHAAVLCRRDDGPALAVALVDGAAGL